MSNVEGDQWRRVRIHHESWNRFDDAPVERSYVADWPSLGDEARASGHGGGDFWTTTTSPTQYGREAYWSLMSTLALPWRPQASRRGGPVWTRADPIRYLISRTNPNDANSKNDHWSPFPEDAGPDQPPPSIRGYVAPSAEAVTFAQDVWRSIGYEGE